MKDFKLVKTIQLAIMVLLSAVIIGLILLNSELYHEIAVQTQVHLLSLFLWLLLAVCFAGLIYDFTVIGHLKRKYGEIDMAMYSDPLTGIGNRSSLDAFIDEYSNASIPSGIGSITFTITHMREINDRYGNSEGDRIIKDFSNILADCGKGICFVGRNGGNNFLALFRESDEAGLDNFVAEVINRAAELNKRNTESMADILFKYGYALSDASGSLSMNELVALSYRNAMNKQKDDCGLWND